jgi:hypothetical protein
MPNDLIELTKWPSMPAPWSSVDPGEAWVWGDYVAILQTKPIPVVQMMAEMTGQKGIGDVPIKYPFALTVFYRKDRNPHGPSSRPVLTATLERMDYATAASQGIILPDMMPSGEAPVVQGLFTAEARFNLGDFQGELTRDSARRYFLNVLKSHFSLEGEPVKIGVIADVYGHPNTGWPAKEDKKSKSNFPVLASLALIIIFIAIWVLINYK